MTTYALIPGAGGQAWYWHRVVPLLPGAVAVDLPAGDDAAGLNEYADAVCDALSGVSGPVVLVAQSMGAFTAPLVAERIRTAEIVLVNPMVPAPGESAGQWWAATGQDRLVPEFDTVEDFFHDVPDDVRAEAFSRAEPEQADTPFGQPWPLQAWPNVPTRVIQGRDDRLFPLEFQRRLVRERLGLELIDIPGGHLMALSQPELLVTHLLAAAK